MAIPRFDGEADELAPWEDGSVEGEYLINGKWVYELPSEFRKSGGACERGCGSAPPDTCTLNKMTEGE